MSDRSAVEDTRLPLWLPPAPQHAPRRRQSLRQRLPAAPTPGAGDPEGKIERLGGPPLLTSCGVQLPLGAARVHGKLQCTRGVRRPARLVVDYPEGAVRIEIDTVDDATYCHRPAGRRTSELEASVDPVLEQPVRRRRSESRLPRRAPARRGRARPPNPVATRGPQRDRSPAAYRWPPRLQPEAFECHVEVRQRNRTMAGRLPAPKERLEHPMQEQAALLRRYGLLALGSASRPSRWDAKYWNGQVA